LNNLSDRRQKITLILADKDEFQDLLTGEVISVQESGGPEFDLFPYQYRWLKNRTVS